MPSHSNNSDDELTDITGVDSSLVDSLGNAGLDSIADIKAASQSELVEVTGISKLTARRIKSQVGGANATMDGDRDSPQTGQSTTDTSSTEDSDDVEVTSKDSSVSVSVSTTHTVDENNNIPLTAFFDDSVSEGQSTDNEAGDTMADSEDILDDLIGEFDEMTGE